MVGLNYRLEIEGEFTELGRRELGATTLWHENGNTVLEVLVRDQSELQGLLERVSVIGLTLVSAAPMTDTGLSGTDRARSRGRTT